MMKQKNFFLAFFSLLLTGTNSFCQQHNQVYDNTISEAVKAYYEYLPQGYPAAGVKYPMILFVHGFGERGPGTSATLPLVLRNGIPRLINEGTFPTSFTVGGQTFKFIIVSPQFAATGFPSVNDINNMINYAIAKYPIDINRIYLTGLSMGGGVSWYYPGYNSYYASRIAATVPVCGAELISQTSANNIAGSNLPVWATHNSGDPQVDSLWTYRNIDLINNRPTPPNPLAKKTIFRVSGHDAWSQTYNPNFRENGLNVYEWMLQFKRNFTVLPVNGLSFTVQQISTAKRVQLKWNTQQEFNIRGFKVMRSTDGVNFNQIGFINAAGLNGNGSLYNFIDESALAGKNFYRLSIEEINGDLTMSDVKRVDLDGYNDITISPNPVKETINLQTGLVIKNATLQIFNIGGAQVFSKIINGSGNIAIKINSIAPGVYIARIIDRKMVRQLKFIKE